MGLSIRDLERRVSALEQAELERAEAGQGVRKSSRRKGKPAEAETPSAGAVDAELEADDEHELELGLEGGAR